MALQITYKRPIEIQQWPDNSRTHSTKQIAQLCASIKEFGFTNPILVDEQDYIIAGHGRLEAAEILQIEMVPTIRLDGLSEAQKAAYVIADNKLALNAGWDEELLQQEIQKLQDMDFNLDLLGFDDDELTDLLIGDLNFSPATEDEQGRLDELEPKYVDCPHCGKEFDLREWQN